MNFKFQVVASCLNLFFYKSKNVFDSIDWYLSRIFIKKVGEAGVRNGKKKANFVYLTMQNNL